MTGQDATSPAAAEAAPALFPSFFVRVDSLLRIQGTPCGGLLDGCPALPTDKAVGSLTKPGVSAVRALAREELGAKDDTV